MAAMKDIISYEDFVLETRTGYTKGAVYNIDNFAGTDFYMDNTYAYLDEHLKEINNSTSLEDAQYNCTLLEKLHTKAVPLEKNERNNRDGIISYFLAYIRRLFFNSLERYYKLIMEKAFKGRPVFASAILLRVFSVMSGATQFSAALWEISCVIGCSTDTLSSIVSKAGHRLGSFAACRERFTTIDNKKLSEGMYWSVDRKKSINSTNDRVHMPKLDKQLRPFERDVFETGYTASAYTHMRGSKQGKNTKINTDPQLTEGDRLDFALSMIERIQTDMPAKSYSEEFHTMDTPMTPRDIKRQIQETIRQMRYNKNPMTAYQTMAQVRKFAYAMAKNFKDELSVNLWFMIAWDAFKKGAWNIVLEVWEMMARDMKRSSLEERARYFVANLRAAGIKVSNYVTFTEHL
jgi:hypothetical protein